MTVCTAAIRMALPLLAGMLLLACGHKPPTPAWQINSHAALQAAENAWLAGRTPEAQHEWNKAREQVSFTGDPARLARLELRRCAVQVASLDWQDCTGFEVLRLVAGQVEQAYADYLYAPSATLQTPLLPAAQQGVARVLEADAPAAFPQAVAAVAKVEEPLSRLLAAAVALRRYGAAENMPENANGPAMQTLLQTAIDTASAQGWRRPLLAWLALQAQYAQRSGNEALLVESQMRIRLIENRGDASASPAIAPVAGAEPSDRP